MSVSEGRHAARKASVSGRGDRGMSGPQNHGSDGVRPALIGALGMAVVVLASGGRPVGAAVMAAVGALLTLAAVRL